MTLELYPYGDSELWYALGQAGNWSLPVLVHWRHDRVNDKHYGLVVPAVGLYYSQALTLKGLLQVHDIQGNSDSWLIPRMMVESLLHKAPGITVLAYYKWPDEDMPAIPLSRVVKTTADGGSVTTFHGPSCNDPFVKYISEKSSISTSIVRAVIAAITENGSAWMLEKRRPIELGFCRLIAAPFRCNWKEIVSYKLKKFNLLSIFKMSQRQRTQELENIGMPGTMCSPDNVALKRGSNRIEYTIEAIPTAKFENEVARVETYRMAAGRISYIEHFERTVRHLYANLLESLKVYMRKKTAPFATVHEGRDDLRPCFMPTTMRPSQMRNLGLGDTPVYIVSPASDFSVFREKGGAVVVQKEIASVPKVPALLQAPNDMRQSDEQRNDGDQWKEAASGMSLQYANQEPIDRC